MICDRCGKEVYYLYGRVVDDKRYLLCWDCIILLKEKENETI